MLRKWPRKSDVLALVSLFITGLVTFGLGMERLMSQNAISLWTVVLFVTSATSILWAMVLIVQNKTRRDEDERT
jgi:hypothetical protein